MQELFEESGRPETMAHFLEYWVQRDDKLLVDCLEWEEMIQQLTTNTLEAVGDRASEEVAAEKSRPLWERKALTNTSLRPDEDSIKGRLRRLFEFYTKKEDRTLQTLTFEEMTTHIKRMSLTTWMHFCKDCNLTSLLGKQEVHVAFRKSTIKLLSFEQFEKALTGLLERVHPEDISNGWKMVGVFD